MLLALLFVTVYDVYQSANSRNTTCYESRTEKLTFVVPATRRATQVAAAQVGHVLRAVKSRRLDLVSLVPEQARTRVTSAPGVFDIEKFQLARARYDY